jgi:hypothetical protein
MRSFPRLLLQGFSYAIRMHSGSTLVLTDTCFVDNNFVGDGTVVVVDKEVFIGSGNYGTMDDGLKCQFLSLNGTCVEYDSNTCVPDPSLTTTDTKAPAVAVTPTSAPTANVTDTKAPAVAATPTSAPTANLTETEAPAVAETPTLAPTPGNTSETEAPVVIEAPTMSPTPTANATATEAPAVAEAPMMAPTPTPPATSGGMSLQICWSLGKIIFAVFFLAP